eukprot:1192047-Prorocentrum_minimum.AAC.4
MLTRSVVVVVAAQVRFLEQGDYVLSAFINSQPVRNTPAKFHVVAKDATHREMEEEEQELEALKQARGADMDFEVDSDDDDDDDAASWRSRKGKRSDANQYDIHGNPVEGYPIDQGYYDANGGWHEPVGDGTFVGPDGAIHEGHNERFDEFGNRLQGGKGPKKGRKGPKKGKMKQGKPGKTRMVDKDEVEDFPDVNRNDPDAISLGYSVLEGEGARVVTAGEQGVFTLQTVNFQGRKVTTRGLKVAAVVTTWDGRPVKARVSEKSAGVYRVSYTVTLAGPAHISLRATTGLRKVRPPDLYRPAPCYIVTLAGPWHISLRATNGLRKVCPPRPIPSCPLLYSHPHGAMAHLPPRHHRPA